MAVQRGARITGDQRATMARELGERYAAGESIRTLADSTGRSYGFVQALVRESGVAVRSRGGAVARPAGSGRRSVARSSGSGTGRSVAARRATTAKRSSTKTAANRTPSRRSTSAVVTDSGEVEVPTRITPPATAGDTGVVVPADNDARGSAKTADAGRERVRGKGAKKDGGTDDPKAKRDKGPKDKGTKPEDGKHNGKEKDGKSKKDKDGKSKKGKDSKAKKGKGKDVKAKKGKKAKDGKNRN